MTGPGKPKAPDKGVEIDPGELDKEEINLDPDHDHGQETSPPPEPE